MNITIEEEATKVTYDAPGSTHRVIVKSLGTIDAEDGSYKGESPLVAVWRSSIRVRCFDLIEKCGIGTSFIQRMSKVSFQAQKCAMIPYRIRVRRKPYGSTDRRLQVDFFLKTADGRWGKHQLPVDNPLITFANDVAELHLPDQPLSPSFLTLSDFPFKHGNFRISDGRKLRINNDWQQYFVQKAKLAFLALEKQFELQEMSFTSLGFEFGINHEGEILLADIVAPDSFLIKATPDVDRVAELLRNTANATRCFRVPTQQIIVWDVYGFVEGISEANIYAADVEISIVKGALHNRDLASDVGAIIQRLLEIPDSVLIVYASNASVIGQLPAEHVTVPVIFTPIEKRFSGGFDLMTISNIMVNEASTVLGIEHACRHALKILAKSSPRLHAHLALGLGS
jgi:phosphoribosylaminoimidazole-succinocarboxamide synthase